MVSARSGFRGLRSGAFQTVMPSEVMFSNDPGWGSRGFPTRTAGIWREPHHPVRVSRYSVTFPPRAEIKERALGVIRIMYDLHKPLVRSFASSIARAVTATRGELQPIISERNHFIATCIGMTVYGGLIDRV
jgi:hypothetical protein